MKEKDILFEKSGYWITKNSKGHFEVFRNNTAHSTRCAYIGFEGQKGLDRAKQEIERRVQESEAR